MSFFIRKIKKGRIKINNKYFYPDDTSVPYDNRLEGMDFVFATYDKTAYINNREFVYLWGTKEQYKNKGDENINLEQPLHCVNGTYVWCWWYEEILYQNMYSNLNRLSLIEE